MEDLDYIRELLEKFVHNIDNKEGSDYLRDALTSIREVLDKSNEEYERKIADNLMRTYRHMVVEKAKTILSVGTPCSERLSHTNILMRIFTDFDFDEDAGFQAFESKISSELYDQMFIGLRGKRLKDFDASDNLWFKRLLEQIKKEVEVP